MVLIYKQWIQKASVRRQHFKKDVKFKNELPRQRDRKKKWGGGEGVELDYSRIHKKSTKTGRLA